MPENNSTMYAKIGRAAGRIYRRTITEQDRKAAGNIGCIVIIVAAWAIGFWIYSSLDDAGYLSHTRETLITAEQSWMIGESKTCVSDPLEPAESHALHRRPWDVTGKVRCDFGPEHHIKVTFHGRIERAENRARWGVSWKCVRRPDSFECYALD